MDTQQGLLPVLPKEDVIKRLKKKFGEYIKIFIKMRKKRGEGNLTKNCKKKWGWLQSLLS